MPLIVWYIRSLAPLADDRHRRIVENGVAARESGASGTAPALTRSLWRNYGVIMRARIVRIGNSQGVRIPKALLEQTGLSDEVKLEAVEDRIVIRPAFPPRHDWDSAFARMAERGDDELVDDVANQSSFDDEEWEW